MANTDAQVWSYCHSVCITAGVGALELLPTLLPAEGRVLLVTSAGFTRRGVTQRLVKNLGVSRVVVYDKVKPNPELDDLDEAAADLRSTHPEIVVGLGGGSVMDAAKVLAVTVPSKRIRPLSDVFRGDWDPKWRERLKVITIPTTSGTGAEVTPFATLWDSSSQEKHSLTGDFMYPVHALLDPELTVSLPIGETLYPGLDAISHALESLWNKYKTPTSAAMSLQALSIAVGALPAVLKDPHNLLARERMQQASLLAGLAISQTRTAVAHSVSYPLTSRFGMPHGLACSFTLPELLRLNLPMLVAENPNQELVFILLLDMLRELNLHEHVARYASPEDVQGVKGWMSAKDRIGNFTGTLGPGLDILLERSLFKI